MVPGDSLLLGTDLLKDRSRLIAAYDDHGGVTAEFNKNLLRVLNRELDGDFSPDDFDHVARFDEEGSFIEMRLRSTAAQRVQLSDLDLEVHFGDGEDLRTEISTKFRPEQVEVELAAAGLQVERRWSDPDDDFALWMARR